MDYQALFSYLNKLGLHHIEIDMGITKMYISAEISRSCDECFMNFNIDENEKFFIDDYEFRFAYKKQSEHYGKEKYVVDLEREAESISHTNHHEEGTEIDIGEFFKMLGDLIIKVKEMKEKTKIEE